MKYIKTYKNTFDNLSDEDKISKLIDFARHGGSDTLFEELANSGIDINTKIGGDTALIWSAFKGFIGKVDILIEAEANLDIQDDEGNTSLMLAAYSKNNEIVYHLIEAGASWNIKNNDGNDFLDTPDYYTKHKIIEKYPEQYKKYLMIKKSEKFNL
jgi:ankyrin repeat protein